MTEATGPAPLRSGRILVLLLLLGAAVVIALRSLCVPVGSFRAGLDNLAWGITADSVRSILGEPNVICTDPSVAHLRLSVSPDTLLVRRTLAAATAERWVYARPHPDEAVPRDNRPECAAPVMGTELGFDHDGRLRWYVREMDQTPPVFDPELASRPVPAH